MHMYVIHDSCKHSLCFILSDFCEHFKYFLVREQAKKFYRKDKFFYGEKLNALDILKPRYCAKPLTNH